MMLHGLDILRVNMYIVYKNMTDDKRPKDHKGFISEFICALLNRARSQTYRPLRSSSPAPRRSPTQREGKRTRMSKREPQLPLKRFDKPKELHVATTAPGNKQRECIYCRYLKAKQQISGEQVTIKVKEPSRMCSYCQEHICKQHFDVYHSRTS